MVLVLLALWMPVSLHCALERLPGLHWLQCCCADGADAQTPTNCERQPCASLEAGAVKAEERVAGAPAPPLLPLLPALAPIVDLLSAPLVEPGQLGAVPPELAPCWRFTFRAARSPRAPSLFT